MSTLPEDCPCGSGARYRVCCGPRHDGTKPAETAEALMRSRYSAFVLGEGEYLVETRAAPPRIGEAEELGQWGRSVTWLGLTVTQTEEGGVNDERGRVSFEARFLEDGEVVTLAESSRFLRDTGKWRYLDGEPKVTRAKVERNQPCPCGSGKKFKQCHA